MFQIRGSLNGEVLRRPRVDSEMRGAEHGHGDRGCHAVIQLEDSGGAIDAIDDDEIRFADLNGYIQ